MKLLNALLSVFLAIFPSYTPPAGLGLSALSAADFLLPLSELGLLFGAMVAYATASLGYMAIIRIIAWIRG